MSLNTELSRVYKPFISIQKACINRQYGTSNMTDTERLIVAMLDTEISVCIRDTYYGVPLYNSDTRSAGTLISTWLDDVEKYLSLRGLSIEDVQALRFFNKHGIEFEFAHKYTSTKSDWCYAVGNYSTIFTSLCKIVGFNTEVPPMVQSCAWLSLPETAELLSRLADPNKTIFELYNGFGVRLHSWVHNEATKDINGHEIVETVKHSSGYHRYLVSNTPRKESNFYPCGRFVDDLQSAATSTIQAVLLKNPKGHLVKQLRLDVVKDGNVIESILAVIEKDCVYQCSVTKRKGGGRASQ